MPPKNGEIKQEEHQNFEENLEKYTQLVLELLNDKDFKKYTEFSYLISKPEYHLLSKEIKKKVLQHCKEHFENFGYD